MRVAVTSLLFLTLVRRSRADPHPPPTGLTSQWLDRFTVMVSWKTQDILNNNNKKLLFLVNMTRKEAQCLIVNKTSLRENFLTEEMVADHWECNIQTVNQCAHTNSIPATLKIFPFKPRAELVKDFKCFIQDTKELNCSWIPVNATLNLTISYREFGVKDETIKSLKTCTQPHSIGVRKGCILHGNPEDIRILVEADTAISTFKPQLVVSPPKLTITAEKDDLNLSLTPPTSAQCWIYNVCYKECNNSKGCQEPMFGVLTIKVPHDKRCLYEFTARTMSRKYCFETDILSHYSDPVFYGINKTSPEALTVITIVIPVILSICVILSCYCFRKHSAILCPVIPDPSVMFKEMMSGNKEHKSVSGGLYTPVPEPIEPCKIIVVSENNEPRENP